MDRVRESYGRVHQRLWRSLLVYCGDSAPAEAVEVEAIRRVIADDPEDIDGHLWRSAFELAAAYRADRRRPVMPGAEAQPVTIVDADKPVLVELMLPLDPLPDRRRAIAVLGSVAELTAEEIADALSLPTEAVAAEWAGLKSLLADRELEVIRHTDVPDLWPRIEARPGAGVVSALLERRAVAAMLWILLVVAGAAGLYRLTVPAAERLGALPAADPQPGSAAPDTIDRGNGTVDRGDGNPGDGNRGARPESALDRPAAAAVTGSAGPALPLVLTAGENGAAVYDLQLPSGARFRLSLPARLHGELDRFFPRTPPGVIHVTGPGQTDLRIAFTFCAGQDAMTAGRNGSLIAGGGETGSITFCRPDDILVTTVTTDLDLDDDELEVFDLRPVALDDAYRQHRELLIGTPTFAGPTRVGSVIVNAVGPGRISAVDAVDLSEQWTYPSVSDESRSVVILAPSITGPFRADGLVHDDAEGVWLAEAGSGIVNLDPATGTARWRLDAPGEPGGVWGADGQPWFVWTSFPGEGDNRPPVLLRVDPATGDVLWRIEGRDGADWGWNPVAATSDQVFIADVYADPTVSSNGAGSVVGAYDVVDGELDFTVTFDAPEGMWADTRLVQVLAVDDEPMLLSKTTHGLLSRIDVPDGRIRWSTHVNPGVLRGLAQLSDETWAIRVQASPAGPYYLDVETGARLSNVDLPPPPGECRTEYGPVAWVVLWQPSDPAAGDGPVDPNEVEPPPRCVVVAESQRLQLWNKGDDPMVLAWTDRREQVRSDDHVELTPVGHAFPIGPNLIDVEPYPDLTVWVMAADGAPTAGFSRTARSYGPIAVGMTVAEAAQSLGFDLELIAFDTSGGCMVIAGDPYSPLFRTRATATGLIITGIDGDEACP